MICYDSDLLSIFVEIRLLSCMKAWTLVVDARSVTQMGPPKLWSLFRVTLQAWSRQQKYLNLCRCNQPIRHTGSQAPTLFKGTKPQSTHLADIASLDIIIHLIHYAKYEQTHHLFCQHNSLTYDRQNHQLPRPGSGLVERSKAACSMQTVLLKPLVSCSICMLDPAVC